MSSMRPVLFTWTPEGVMEPVSRFKPLCDRQFAVHEQYALGVVEHRSTRSHNHLFAAIASVWENLNDTDAKRFPTIEHLRKWLLVQAGHATEANYILDTPRDAGRMARGLRAADAYSVIRVSGNVVKVWTAKSLSRTTVANRNDFQNIKTAVFHELEKLSGISHADLTAEAKGRAAPGVRHELGGTR